MAKIRSEYTSIRGSLQTAPGVEKSKCDKAVLVLVHNAMGKRHITTKDNEYDSGKKGLPKKVWMNYVIEDIDKKGNV